MNDKILLIRSPSTVFARPDLVSLKKGVTEEIPMPLGVCYLGAVLRDKGFDVEIYDPHIEHYEEYMANRDPQVFKDAIRGRLARRDYRILGVSVLYAYLHRWCHFVAEVAKEMSPHTPVVVGGGYPSILKERTLRDPNIDFVIVGEAESSFPRFLDVLLHRSFETFEQIDGLIYRRHGEVVFNPKQHFIEDLDTIPYPAWDMVPFTKYLQYAGRSMVHDVNSAIMMTSRGCPYRCTFCNVFVSWGRQFRKRSVENLLGEVEYLVKTYGVNDLLFVDDNLTIDKHRTMDFFEGLSAFGITWAAVNISSWLTNEPMLKVMKKSGCTHLSISVESAVASTLKQMKKPVKLDWTKEMVRICREIGINLSINYVTGLPYDDKEAMLQTFRYSEEVRASWNVYSILVPYQDTEIYQYCEEQGYIEADALDLDTFSIRNVHVEANDWTSDWVVDQTYDWNIKTNFLRNYDLTEPDGDPDVAIDRIKRVYTFYPKHLIAVICLAFAHHRKGDMAEELHYLTKAQELLDDSEVLDAYGKYLDWDEEILRYFHTQGRTKLKACDSRFDLVGD